MTPKAIDGIINKERYAQAKTKVAFLLKEVNAPGMTEDWHYADDWLYKQSIKPDDPDFHKTFANVVRWLACVECPDITYVECDDYKKYCGLVAQTAVINIHKGAGGSSSDWEVIEKYAIENADTIRQQVSEIAPDILICGGTYYFAQKYIFRGAEEKTLPCGANYFQFGKTKVVEFVHPAWFSVDRKILFAYFKTVYNDLLKLS